MVVTMKMKPVSRYSATTAPMRDRMKRIADRMAANGALTPLTTVTTRA